MYSKAVHFAVDQTAKAILQVANPLLQQQLGRRIKTFNSESWKTVKESIVQESNIMKFSQDDHLHKLLLSIAIQELVEASPVDRVLGIGLSEKGSYHKEEMGTKLSRQSNHERTQPAPTSTN